MAVSVYIPGPYRHLTDGRAAIAAAAGTTASVLAEVCCRHPALRTLLRAQPALCLNGSGRLVAESSALHDGDELALVPAVAGGAHLTDEQMERYSRQVLLPQVGIDGQRRLLGAKVLVIGAGGLGSPAAIYLAAAGVGTIGVVDGDRVERSNLHRQPLHSERTVGLKKTESARRFLQDLNPDVQVTVHDGVLSSANALDILRPYDVVVNGSDNFPTRYLVSDACVLLGKPLVDAAILRFEGQATIFAPGKGCYRCLYPDPPAPGSVPSCAEAGILGAVAGQIGTLQATEALKLLLGIGETLAGKLWLYDALEGRVHVLRWHRNPQCPVCGDEPTIRELIDYDQFCGVPHAQDAAPSAARLPYEISVAQAAERLQQPDVQWVDVRPRAEQSEMPFPALRVDLDDLQAALPSIEQSRPVVFFCTLGKRSAIAAEALQGLGYRAFSVVGGVLAWQNSGLLPPHHAS